MDCVIIIPNEEIGDFKALIEEAKKKGAIVVDESGSLRLRKALRRRKCKEDDIKKLLLQLGIKTTHKGYVYMKYILEKCVAEPGYHALPVTKVIYPECGKEYGVTTSAIEKSLIYAINHTYEKNAKMYQEIFNLNLIEPPTPSEFIVITSEYLLRNKK